MLKKIIKESKIHAPFTLFGALSGIFIMLLFKNISYKTAHNLFYVFHPLHICLSAIVTASLYKKYAKKNNTNIVLFIKVLFVGYLGSISIGTLSDSLIPFWSETLLNAHPKHIHIGFIDKWWIINPLVIISIIFAYFKPTTKLPHTGHVLISTWASLFHMLMSFNNYNVLTYIGLFIFLFIAVWLPCCFSDILFPLIFINKKDQ